MNYQVTYQVQPHLIRRRSPESSEACRAKQTGLKKKPMKKPILLFRVRRKPFLNALTVAESTTHCSNPFQRLITRSEKKCCLKSNPHLFFTSLAVCPLVRVAGCRTKKSLNGVADRPLYILKTSNKSALFLLSSRVHNPKYSSLCS